MDQSIETLVSNPVYMAVAVVLAVIILLGVIKKLIKVVLVVSSLLILWVAYMVWNGDDVSIKTIKESVQTKVEAVKDKTFETRSIVGETVNKKIEEKTEEQLKKILPNK